MSDLWCVTNRTLCPGDFLARIEEIARCAPAAIIVREKDMDEDDYARLLKKIIPICRTHGVPCVLHTFVHTAIAQKADGIHLPLSLLRSLRAEEKTCFPMIGASCHSLADAVEAEQLGCTYLTLGHIFETDCKKGLPPRGLRLLQEVCAHVKIPILAIGGIHAENIHAVRRAGAAGACVMSGLMRCDDVRRYMQDFASDP